MRRALRAVGRALPRRSREPRWSTSWGWESRRCFGAYASGGGVETLADAQQGVDDVDALFDLGGAPLLPAAIKAPDDVVALLSADDGEAFVEAAHRLSSRTKGIVELPEALRKKWNSQWLMLRRISARKNLQKRQLQRNQRQSQSRIKRKGNETKRK